ncbi:hypothetical protein N9I73_00575 [Porticoccaceae bacterium]|jgi:hypothetical protein|nr:hypothetical protein [Porticoccaceae bacterium]MDA9014065.1 hypothetical protein [Porticoccaceae bacterium]
MSDQQSLTAKQQSFRYQIWLMLIIVFGVIAFGFLMVPKSEEQRQKMIELFGTTNQGQLVKPALDVSAALAAVPAPEKPKWKIVIVGGNFCDQTCEDLLLNTRQIHMLLGKYTGRVQRIFLQGPNQVMDEQWLTEQHPFLQLADLDVDQFKQLLVNNSADWDMASIRYFVVTPDNKAILYFTADNDANGLLDDLKHLLKYSPDR